MSAPVLPVNDPRVLAELTKEFERYEVALMANDVATLDALFWKSELTLRYGVAENLRGHEAILRYRQLRPGGSPQRRLQNTVITTFGDAFGTANTEFLRLGPAAAGAIGRQSQTWVRLPEGWRIVAAHVSLIAVKDGT
jgi:hypothetical protein